MAKILIIDDDPDISAVGTIVLEKEGHQVECAESRETGMKKISSFKPDLLILDVIMEQPDTGFSMAQELRRQGYAKPILMLTSVSRATGLTFQMDEEMVPVDALCEKPLSPADLVTKVNELLARKGGCASCS